jgi:hypothetical protein
MEDKELERESLPLNRVNINPFDNREREITFKTLVPNNIPNTNWAQHQYLDAKIYDDGTVMTSPLTTGMYTGTHWKVIKNEGNNDYSFKTLVPNNTPNTNWAQHQYLDAKIYDDGTAMTSPLTTGMYTGTHWKVIKNEGNNDYSFKTLVPNNIPNTNWAQHQYLDAKIYDDGTVMTSPLTTGMYTGTHWKIGISALTSTEVTNIVNNVYSSININKFNKYLDTDRIYQTLDTSTVTTIWKKGDLKNYTWTREKFDCDDFAVCFKAQVSRWIYTQQQPTGSPKGAALGIMWGRNQSGGHAYNFYITPYLELKLIEPQSGDSIHLDAWTPFFAML